MATGRTCPIAESEDWAMALVAAGVGIAIVPEGVARANPDVAVREIDVDVKREVGLAYSSSRPPSEVLQNFIARQQSQRPKAGRAKSAGKTGR
jgi:DNA-binding transcriptional LysR family regulator